jgi:hypothetical protein
LGVFDEDGYTDADAGGKIVELMGEVSFSFLLFSMSFVSFVSLLSRFVVVVCFGVSRPEIVNPPPLTINY